MSEEEKQPQGNNPSTEENHLHNQTEVLDDARSLALSEALQSSFKVVRVLMAALGIAFLCSGITTSIPLF